jgi:hypothetical protein
MRIPEMLNLTEKGCFFNNPVCAIVYAFSISITKFEPRT